MASTKLDRAELDELHHEVELRLSTVRQRYTRGRRQLIELLAASPQPLDMRVIAQKLTDVPQSSAYRTLAVFTSLGIAHRISGEGDGAHFELSDDLFGAHHHHGLCRRCGKVVDIDATPKLERALAEAAQAAGDSAGIVFDRHRIELVGLCKKCA